MHQQHDMQYPMAYPKMQNPMHEGTMKDYSHQKEMYDFCKKHKDHYVMVVYDGIIINVEADTVQILMPVGEQRHEDINENRQFFGYGGFPFRFRRFHRFPLPFFGIRRFLFPFFY
ncbi:hypothetical protein QGM71_03450 [Virgibacillus sp. C22-A2]|uniref:Spore coat protein n=1 Tax=Virgibacillus tibetensis TaxID=3042313 RepID=A0ABU6KB40_9BACI|nr:hypothetical protein [Virgibacillus sp. C22-A2]